MLAQKIHRWDMKCPGQTCIGCEATVLPYLQDLKYNFPYCGHLLSSCISYLNSINLRALNKQSI